MRALSFLVKWWRSHGTAILGFAGGFAAGAVLIPDLIPQAHQKYWAAANLAFSLLTIQRSQTNRRNINSPPPHKE